MKFSLSTEEIYDKYIENNSENKFQLTKAIYAYGFDELIGKVYAPHKFYREHAIDSNTKFDICTRCHKSRVQIRWDDESPECANWIKINIAEVIESEEEKYFSLISKWENILPDIIKTRYNNQISGKMLFELQSTHGVNPDLVSTILDIDIEKYMPEFEECMDSHKSKSGNMFKGK